MPSGKVNLLMALVVLLATGCTMEQKLARSYVKMQPPAQFLYLEPDYLFKNNLKTYEIEEIDSMDEAGRDSLLLSRSLFLKDISDSSVIKSFSAGFIKSFESYGVKVLGQKEFDSLLSDAGQHYIINIAQFSLEEFTHPYSSEEYVYDEVLVIDGFDVNAVSYNIWIELSKMNSETKNKVLFTSDFLTDEVNGVLRQNLLSGKYSFDFTIDTITPDMAYKFSRQMGSRTAAYVYDYLLNTYVKENLPENYPYEPYYYHYDPQRKLLFTIDEDQRILELDGK